MIVEAVPPVLRNRPALATRLAPELFCTVPSAVQSKVPAGPLERVALLSRPIAPTPFQSQVPLLTSVRPLTSTLPGIISPPLATTRLLPVKLDDVLKVAGPLTVTRFEPPSVQYVLTVSVAGATMPVPLKLTMPPLMAS